MPYSKRLDFGGSSTPVAAGYLRFGTGTYTAARGFGWVAPAGLSLQDTGYADPLTRDCVRGGSGTFRLDVPNGRYTVTITTCDPRERGDVVTLTLNGVVVQTPAPAQNVNVTTLTVDVTDGKITLTPKATGPATPYWGLAALSVEGVEAPVPPPPPPVLPGVPGVVAAVTDPVPASFTVPCRDFPYLRGSCLVRFRLDALPAANAALVAAIPPVLPPPGFALGVDAAGVPFGTASLHLDASDPAGAKIAPITVKGTAPLPVSSWHTLAVVWDPDTVTLHANGQVVGTLAKNDPPSIQQITEDDYFAGVPLDTPLSVEVLGSFWFGEQLRGAVSHAVLSGAAWTPAEVAAALAWAGGTPPPPPPPEPEPLTVTLGPDLISDQHAVTFAPAVTGGTPPYAFAWDYGDGTTGTASDHRYDANGTYAATVTVTDGSTPPRQAMASVQVTVDHVHPDVPPPPDGRFYFTRHGDRLCDYCYQPTISSVQHGDALDPATWGGRLPSATDRVVQTHAVTLAGPLTVHSWKVAAGTLQVDAGADLKLFTLQVHEGGRLVGSGKARIKIRNAPIDTTFDPEQTGHGLNVTGEFVTDALPKTAFAEVAEELRAGSTALRLAAAAIGWQPGDTLIIPDTRQYNFDLGPYEWQGEEVTIQSVSADRRTVELAMPLRYDHRGFRGRRNPVLDYLVSQLRWKVIGYDSPDLEERPVQFLFHVQNVSRDFVIESEDVNGVPGHCLFTDMAEVDLEGVEFRNLGRTRNDPIQSTLWSGDTPTRIGTNQIGRYGVHFHHLHGPAPRIAGCSVWNPGVDHPRKWGIAIHGTSNAVVSDGVFYNLAGAGVVTEDGSERGNVIERCYVLRVRHPFGSNHVDDAGNPLFTGSDIAGGFWIINPDNTIRDCIASGISGGGEGAGFYFFGKPLAAATLPMREFARNQCYGMTTYGLSIWNLGMNSDQDQTTAVGLSTVKDFFVAHVHGRGHYPYNASNVLFDGLVVRGDVLVSSTGSPATAFASDEYAAKNIHYRNVDAQGIYAGASIGPVTWGTSVLDTAYFSDLGREAFAQANLGVSTTHAARAGDRRTILRNILYGPNVPQKIALFFNDLQSNNYTALDELLVYRHGGDAAKNYRVYHRRQAASEILPPSVQYPDGTYQVKGSPEPGLTNAQAWSKYGLATGGKVAPANVVDGLSEGIDGLLEPIAAEGAA